MRLHVALLAVFLAGFFLWLDTGIAGDKFTNIYQDTGLPSHKGAYGASWHDYDSDGWIDLLLARGEKGLSLFRNEKGNGFSDTTLSAGLDAYRKDLSSALLADINNDGCTDIFLGYRSENSPEGSGIRVLKGNCRGAFSDVTPDNLKSAVYEVEGMAAADYERDGDLDFYTANIGLVEKVGEEFVNEPNRLYRNDGHFQFTDVTFQSGTVGFPRCRTYVEKGEQTSWPKPVIDGLSTKPSFQPIWFDYNLDGWPDLYVANDSFLSVLYRNNGDGTFNDVTEESGVCRFDEGAMGVDVGDFDNDLDPDIYVTNTSHNYLWRNNGDGTFTEVGGELGVTDTSESVGWAAFFIDYDNDADLDLYVVNGVMGQWEAAHPYLPEVIAASTDAFFQNNGDHFVEISGKLGLRGVEPVRTAAWSDFDNNGWMDIYKASNKEGGYLYKNPGGKNRWLKVKLEGTESNRDAVGAKITISHDGKKQYREVMLGSGYKSQNSLIQHFGLGNSKLIEKIAVVWPSGKTTRLSNIEPNQEILIRE